ncbi:MAG TPA: hypothetical protein PLU24_06065 [Candidatus Omnitrophota bacterium]|nr:hypothetical protein [Candidatus Omnitrophota bacterium]
MNENPNEQDLSMDQSKESEVIFLLKKLSDKLTFLEKKIDTLINQPQEKPFRSFNRHAGRDSYRGNRDQGHFGKHRREEGHGFGKHEKHYREDRQDESGNDRPYFKKDQKSGGNEFWRKKKNFFHGRKDRG